MSTAPAGWKLHLSGALEQYRHKLANNVVIHADWDNATGTGTVEAKAWGTGWSRSLGRTRTPIADKDAFWSAAHALNEVAANFPSFEAGRVLFTSSDEDVAETVAGEVEAAPGTNEEPEAELTFATTSGRRVMLTLDREQAMELADGIHRLDSYVWSAEDDEEDDEDDDEEDED